MNTALYQSASQRLKSLADQTDVRGSSSIDRLMRIATDLAQSIAGTPAEARVVERAERLLEETAPGTKFGRLSGSASIYVSMLSDAASGITCALWEQDWIPVIERMRNHLQNGRESLLKSIANFSQLQDPYLLDLPSTLNLLEEIAAYLPPDPPDGTTVTGATVCHEMQRGSGRGLNYLIRELEHYRAKFDQQHSRGCELLRRFRAAELTSPDAREQLIRILRADTPEKIRILAAVAGSLLGPGQKNCHAAELKDGYLAPDEELGNRAYYRTPLSGTKVQIAEAMYAAKHTDSADSHRLEHLAGNFKILIRGKGKMWDVFVRTKQEFEDINSELQKIKERDKSKPAHRAKRSK